jgi:Tfp pilus assembly protein PilF
MACQAFALRSRPSSSHESSVQNIGFELMALGELLRGNSKPAMIMSQKAVRANPTSVDSWVLLAAALISHGLR